MRLTGFPVPRPYGLCEYDGVTSSAFYVMEMVEGRTLWEGLCHSSTADEVNRLIAALEEV